MTIVLSLTILLAERIGAAAGGLAARVTTAARAIRNRRASSTLARLDERMLADIGLTRSDLRDAFAGPIWQDPTDALARRADERRAARPRAPSPRKAA